MCIHICTYICIYTVSPRPKSTVLLTTVTKRSVKNAKCVPSLRVSIWLPTKWDNVALLLFLFGFIVQA